MHQCAVTGIAHRFRQQGSSTLWLVALMDDVDVAFGSIGHGVGLLPKVQQPLHANGKTYRRSRLAAQQFHEPVIASAATNSTLRPETVSHPFEYGKVVIVETTH